MSNSIKPFRCLAMLTLLVVMGCHEDWKTRTYRASGSITINGSSPEGAVIRLLPLNGPIDSRETEPWGVVDGDGHYQLRTYQQNDGAPVGEYAVTVRWPFDRSQPGDRLDEAYSKVENAPAKVSIVKGTNVIPKIEMSNVKYLPNNKVPKLPGLHPPGR